MPKPRKWSNFQEIPEVPEAEQLSKREKRVRQLMDEPDEEGGKARSSMTMKELAAEYQSLCDEDDYAKLEAATRSLKFEALERIIQRHLKRIEEETGQDQWRGEGQLFSPQTSIIPLVKDRAALYKYLSESNLDHLRTLDFSKLKSLVSGVLEAFEQMTPAQRAACSVPDKDGNVFDVKKPLPGVEVFRLQGVHRTSSKPKPTAQTDLDLSDESN